MAKRFKYRFETMLKIRRQREEHHQRVVADRNRQIHQASDQLTSLNRQIQDETNAIRASHQPGTIDMQQAMRHRHWLGHLHKGALETQARLRFLEARLAQERAALAEASKQRKILEKLKEHQVQQHRRTEDHHLMQELDEMATVRYIFDHPRSEAEVRTR